MNEDKNILPVDFDGVFRFTNFTDSEFKARWNSIEYIFPPLSTTPLIIPGETPEAVQNIRKKFAKELAEREFYKTEKFKGMEAQGKQGTPPLYTEDELTGLIQKCLTPLSEAKVTAKPLQKDSEENYKKDNKGRNVTKVLDKDESLTSNGEVIK